MAPLYLRFSQTLCFLVEDVLCGVVSKGPQQQTHWAVHRFKVLAYKSLGEFYSQPGDPVPHGARSLQV